VIHWRTGRPEATVIELHLIGYTADLTHLVFDVDPDARRGGHRLVIDADLFLTLDEIRHRRREAGLDVGDLTDDTSDMSADDSQPSTPERETVEISGELVRILHGDATRPDPPTQEPEDRDDAAADDIRGRDDSGAEDVPPDRTTGGESGELDTAGDADPDAGPSDRPASLLSPAEIQTLLRGGRSPRSVAKRAETDVSWVERWLPPIVAERNQILDRAKQARLSRPRLGASSQLLGPAVETNLRSRGVDLEEIDWSAKRRADGTWSVSVRYTSRGRSRTASWRFDREAGSIAASSRLATELGFTKRRTRRTKA
jgi:hypothetical protein